MTLLHLGPRQAACTALIRLAQMWQKRFQVLVCSFCEFHTPKGKMILTKYLIWKLLLIQMCHLWPPHPLPHPLCLSHKRLFSAITKVLQVHPFDLLWKTQFRNASLSLVSPLFFFSLGTSRHSIHISKFLSAQQSQKRNYSNPSMIFWSPRAV